MPVISTRYSWRIMALAAISLIGNVYLGYYMLFGLASDGLGLDQQSGGVVVTDVGEQTAAARAGFQTGDQILSVNGQQIGTVVDWFAQRMNFEADWPTRIRVGRGADTLDLGMVIHGRIWDEWNSTVRAFKIIFLSYKFITLAIGLFVVFNRPGDIGSRLCGWFLVGIPGLVNLGIVACELAIRYWKIDSLTDRRRFRLLVFDSLPAFLFSLPRVIGTSLINLSPWFYRFFDSPYVYMACTVGMFIFT